MTADEIGRLTLADLEAIASRVNALAADLNRGLATLRALSVPAAPEPRYEPGLAAIVAATAPPPGPPRVVMTGEELSRREALLAQFKKAAEADPTNDFGDADA